MSALHLYEIADQLRALEQLGDTDELPAEVIRDTIEAVEGDFDAKAIAVAKFVLSLEANAAAVKAASEAMAARAKRIANRAESIKSYLHFTLQSLDRKEVKSREIVIRRLENPEAVIITDESAVPETFWIQPPAPPKRIDKAGLKEALKMRAEAQKTVPSLPDIPGAMLERGERLELKC